MPEAPPRFLADAMLERLARWLRVLGYDTTFGGTLLDRDVARIAAAEGRHVLTRDRRLPEEWAVRDFLLVRAARPREQLREVIARYRLARPTTLFTRCMLCNAPLRPARAEDEHAGVPGTLRDRPDALRVCPQCNRTYWEGGHTRRMRAVLDELWDADSVGHDDEEGPA